MPLRLGIRSDGRKLQGETQHAASLPLFRFPNYRDNQKYSINNREGDESQHYIQDLHVAENRGDRSCHKNQINDDENNQLLFRHYVTLILQ